jgi:nucleoside phosphorylase
LLRVLIVDDHPGRYRPLLDALADIGIHRGDIKFLTSTNQAAEELEDNQYDLLILDVLVPAWPDLNADQVNSADLLLAIQNDSMIHKPRYIVGITADLSVVDESAKEFEKNTWTVVRYSAVDDSWIQRIFNCAKYLIKDGEREDTREFNFDLAVVCALKEPELEEVLKLPWHWCEPKPLDDVTFFREGSFDVDGKFYKVAALSSTRMGMVSAAVLTSKAIERLRPRVIAMTGICAGHKDKAHLGDVIVADPAWDFQSGKLKIEGKKAKMEFSPHQIPISHFLRSRFEQMTGDTGLVADITARFGSDAPRGFKLRVGPIASGAAVMADGKVIDEVREFQNRDLLGLEMEIYGMYAAAQQASSPHPKFLALKGVCDFADPDKHDGAQRFGAFASAQVLSKYVERFAKDLFSE